MCLHEEIIEETPEEITEEPKELVFGKVANCAKLRVREEPNAESAVLRELNKDTEVMIDVENSTDEFYSVCTECGIEGFCMKKFIAVQP